MSIIQKSLIQKAVYWAPVALNNFEDNAQYDDFGVAQLGEAVELDVRWMVMQSNIVTAQGTTVQVNNKVMVSADVAVGGYLMLGEICDLQHIENPDEEDLAYEIMKFEKQPAFVKGGQFYRVAYL